MSNIILIKTKGGIIMGQRGRQKGSVGIKSKEAILMVAAEEFAEHGFHETKVSTIVKKAGLTQPSFYLYFSSKEAIFQELVHTFRNKLIMLTQSSRLESNLDKNILSSKIARGLNGIFEFFDDHRNLTKIGFFIASESEEIKRVIVNHITENLLAEQQDNYFRQDLDMQTVAECLMGTIERLTITKLFTDVKNPQQLANEIVDIYLYGLQNHETN
ncbi:TetR/AcrR family transcriptional regulator [Fredinandcohnia sp. QZ13]|uniref:TetR/AcrR family transcriptional regulator n=1 Tax=Fredinandcohnia sp. QZ13 TaxID=3073144 RepID=UPI002853126E|nr:TetR/AcrR family transcriptional regulator [Fredinandcohnia sp. QZ13]MDR4888208.1 TetR/AcrR family transcriptional regulator [Fredinandcohnia sp. QZ13]